MEAVPCGTARTKAFQHAPEVGKRLQRVTHGQAEAGAAGSVRLVSLHAPIMKRLPPRIQGVLRASKRETKALLLAGRSVECPVCHGRFRRLLAVANGEQMLCPRCLSLERHRRVILFLRRSTNLYHDRLRVLHIAPELGMQRELARLPNLEYLTGDLYARNTNLELDVTAIDFPDESFDVILCSHVLEHVVDDRQAMRELRRVLRRDGWALINVPSDPQRTETYEDESIVDPHQRLVHFGQEDHVRIYSAEGFLKRLNEAGFEVEVDPFVFSPYERARYALDDDGWDHSYVCKCA